MASKPGGSLRAFGQRHYVPCLRWKQGEYQAIFRLKAETKKQLTPLIEVPEAGWDFETGADAKTLDQILAPFAKRVEQKWGREACFVDLRLLDPDANMPNSTHPVDFLFADLRRHGCAAIPVTGCERTHKYQRAVRRAAAKDGRGICLRLSLTQAARKDASSTIDELMRELDTRIDDGDLVLDLDAPASFLPIDGFLKLLSAVIMALPYRNRWRTFTLMGTSFPQTMGALQTGCQLLRRYEWIAYKRIAAELLKASCRVPAFGDYGIAHPKVLHIDMRTARPAASVRYTVDDAWYILKGKNVRDHGFSQYHDLCKLVVSSPHFTGHLSEGDKYIAACAHRNVKTGNLTTWRWVGTNHHVEKVVFDIANFFDS